MTFEELQSYPHTFAVKALEGNNIHLDKLSSSTSVTRFIQKMQ